ncbi:hypothetical protein THIARS_60418 [Thiomonas delicata]|uniref:Uncharacterized protein n=1 Tax=Thiomonas delicata TaxID=364030 RepID=A0A238D390_THIDL|nr:hypothetical protein THIARS_60418 [Thiomonas delicata]
MCDKAAILRAMAHAAARGEGLMIVKAFEVCHNWTHGTARSFTFACRWFGFHKACLGFSS